MDAALIVGTAYLAGCFTTGYYLVRWLTGEDIRGVGSGSSGARNVGRALGRSGFLFTLAGDCGKGMLVVAIVGLVDPGMVFLSLLAVTAGHIFPMQFGFRGGKGFATYCGGMLAAAPGALLAAALTAVVIFLFTRSGMKAGLLAVAAVPLFAGVGGFTAAPLPAPWHGVISNVLAVLLVLYAHRENIRIEFGIGSSRRGGAGDGR